MNYGVFRNSKNYTSVSVNHRALITRTLTKYPVDYALFRELLQNSADAKGNSALITFESDDTADPEHPNTLHEASIKKLVFRNDGLVFSEDDWNRLKEIAKGNPDETKIGAFGVGFYSVFELTDAPLVHSGNWVMSFHFVGDELRYSKSETTEYINGTLIDIPYRKSDEKMPDLGKFISFITQSFMLLPLNQVKIHLNKLQLFEITKVVCPEEKMVIPSRMNLQSVNKIFRLNTPTISQLQVNITYLNATQMRKADLKTATGIFSFGKKVVSSFFTSSENPAESTELVCFLQRVDATADVKVSESFKRKLVETVLKPPAKTTKMSLLTYNKASMEFSTLKSPLSDCVFPVNYNDAKLVIGFPTKQSTGIRTHIALNQLIPTMERTAVDMSNATVKDWNCELLYTAGILVRCVYEYEIYNAAREKDISSQLSIAGYTMDRLQLSDSAPDASVGQRLAAGFWRCYNVVAVPTQLGIKPSTEVRLPGTTPKKLIRHTPILSIESDSKKNSFAEQLKQIGYIKELSFEDLAKDLQHSSIDLELLDEFIQWGSSIPSSVRSLLLNAIKVTDKKADIEDVSLGQIKYYQSQFNIPQDAKLPKNCLPAAIVSQYRESDLQVFGWKRLPSSVWVDHMIALNKAEGRTDGEFTEEVAHEVLAVLSKGWRNTTDLEGESIVRLLKPIKCVPTQLGMKRPSDSYLKHIPLFPNLPVVNDTLMVSKQFLLGISVRESVDMAFVLGVLHDPTSTLTWASEDLVNYLAENSKSLRADDWDVLKKGSFFQDTNSPHLVSADHLYAPCKALETLGFHTLVWKSTWNHSSQQAQLLFKIGLRRAPGPTELFEQAIKQNRVKDALNYYLSKFEENGYSTSALKDSNFKIIPLLDGGMASPKGCYYDMEASLFGLNVISRRFSEYQAQRLGLRIKPPVSELLSALFKSPPKSMMEADSRFIYLSTRLGSFTSEHISQCKSTKFIPVKNGHEVPGNVFLGNSSDLGHLFHIIKPSEQATPFLLKIGIQESPSIKDLAWKAVQDPSKVYETIGSAQKYEKLLIKLGAEWSLLKNDKELVARMKESSFLIGETYNAEQDHTSIKLCAASELSLVDNIIILNQFKHLITACPQNNVLEHLSSRLGAQPLSSSLAERATIGHVIPVSNEEEIQELIKERVTLFLESTSKERRLKSKDLKHLKITHVSKIKLERKLRTTPIVSLTTTAFMGPKEPNTLYLTENPDWFDVASVLTKYCITRPDPESVIVLELQLSYSLESLHKKGYNVNRLLNRQRELEEEKLLEKVKLDNIRAEEAKLADSQRKKAESDALAASQAEQAKLASERALLPSSTTNSTTTKASSLKGPDSQVQPIRPEPVRPKPTSDGDSSTVPKISDASGLLKKFFSKPNSLKTTEKLPPASEERETPKAEFTRPQQQQAQAQQQNSLPNQNGMKSQVSVDTIKSAISTSRPYNSDKMSSLEHGKIPRPPMPVSCESQRIYNYKVGAKLNDGLRIFVKNTGSPPTNADIDAAFEFRQILQTCTAIYKVRWDAVALYIGELESIAFNTGGSLFFNLCVFLDRKAQGWAFAKQLDYWFTVMAHELAHNLVADHGEQHSFYTEFYVQEFLSQLHSEQRSLLKYRD